MRIKWVNTRRFVRATTRCLVEEHPATHPLSLGETLRRQVMNCTGHADLSSFNSAQRLWVLSRPKHWWLNLCAGGSP